MWIWHQSCPDWHELMYRNPVDRILSAYEFMVEVAIRKWLRAKSGKKVRPSQGSAAPPWQILMQILAQRSVLPLFDMHMPKSSVY